MDTRIRLIARGDDCGSSRTANAAIRDACRDGILRNVSLMACCDAIEDAAALLAGEKAVCFGLHATVNAEWDSVRWGPVLPTAQVPALVDAHGHFLQTTQALHERRPPVEQVMAELQAQLDRARALGFDVRYADTHMGFTWVAPGLEDAFDAWCAREGLVNDRLIHRGLPPAPAGGDPVEQLIARLEAAPPGQYVVVGHPAYDTPEMRALGHAGHPGDEVAVSRDWQRRIFMDPRITEYCRTHGVAPTRYDEADAKR